MTTLTAFEEEQSICGGKASPVLCAELRDPAAGTTDNEARENL